MIKKISSCRICGNNQLDNILDLGNIHISDFVEKRDQGTKAPLELVLCSKEKDGCGLLQLAHTVQPEKMYFQYWYLSGINESMRLALKNVVENVEKRVPLNEGDAVLDIGSNDGTMLRFYSKGIKLIGIDPAKNLRKLAEEGTTKIITDFFSAEALERELPGQKYRAITAIAMFYDLDYPNEFVKDITKILDKDGIFVIQMMSLPLMLKTNGFDNICVKPDTIILGDNKPIEKYIKNNHAIGKRGKLAKVEATMKRHFDGRLVTIKPKYLESISTTPEHPVRILKKEYLRYDCGQLKQKREDLKLDWIPAKDVKRGDCVVIPKLLHEQNTKELDLTEFNQIDKKGYRRGLLSFPINLDTAWLLGLYVAEGHIRGKESNPYINFSLHVREKHIQKKISSIFESLGYKTDTLFYKDRNTMEVRVVCASLAHALPTWVGKGAINKGIPDFIMLAPEKIKVAFLRGLFEGDGYIKRNKVHFHTSSKTLALQTQLLTASLGGMLGISYVKPYPRIIRGMEVKSKDSWQLRGSSKKLAEIFNYFHQGPEINHMIMDDNYVFVPVKNVSTEAYNGTVHNIETEDETYLVSNAIVHNCHEHLEYYSLHALIHLLDKHGLEVFDAEENEVNGGSIRAYVRFKGTSVGNSVSGGKENVERMLDEEEQMGLNKKETYERFAENVENIKRQFYDFISNEVKNGKKVYAYGASTKGNTLLPYFGVDYRLITAALERNPDKYGKMTVGTHIPIIPEEEGRKANPDYMVVLPWHFLKGFIEREKAYLESGGKFIVPLPEFRVISKEDLV